MRRGPGRGARSSGACAVPNPGVFLSFFFPPGNRPPSGDLRVRDALAQAAVAFTPMTSYRNVLRMHLLIFFFAFAKVVHLDGRLVYLAVLFVYFYPWEAMRRVAGLGPRR